MQRRSQLKLELRTFLNIKELRLQITQEFFNKVIDEF